MPNAKQIYLAGPGVFRPDSLEWGQRLKRACSAVGLAGLYPLDGDIPAEITGKTSIRRWIFANNCDLIRRADAVLADLRAFRSVCEPDSGTAFEIGFAHALGKPVWLWLPDCKTGGEMIGRLPCHKSDAGWIDADGLLVEDFGAPINLMLWDAAFGVSFDLEPESVLATLAAWLQKNQ